MKTEAIDHPKMMDLADWIDRTTDGRLRDFGIDPMSFAVGAMERLWQWVAKYCPAGDIGRYGDARIAQAAGWAGDPSAFVSALTRVGWLDESDEHRLIVHDWPEHCQDTVHARIARKREWFADGSRPNLSKLSSSEKAEAQAFYEVENPDGRRKPPKGPESRRKAPKAADGALPVPVPLPEPIPEPETGWSLIQGSPLPPEGKAPKKRNAENAGNAGPQGDQPGEDSGEGVQVDGRAGSARNRGIAESGCPDWCEPDVWAEAERLTELIETADHPEPVVLTDRDGVRRTVHVARTLQDAGRATVLALAPEGVARTIEALCRPSSALSARLADIAGKLRKYPNATYPNLDGTGRRRNPSMLEEAHRLLTMGERLAAPEARRGGGFRKLAETRP